MCGGRELTTPTAPSGVVVPGRAGILEPGEPAESGWSGATTGVLASLSIDPSVFKGGTSTRGTVTLHEAAPAGGMAIALAVDDTAATVPASITIPQGATSGAFTIDTKTVSADLRIRVTASAGGSSLTALMRLTPENDIASLTVSPSTITAQQTATGKVTLSSAAGSGGAVVSLESSIFDAQVPDKITIAAGGTSGTFTVETRDVSKDTESWITATFGRDSRSVQIRITPAFAVAGTGTVVVGGVVE